MIPLGSEEKDDVVQSREDTSQRVLVDKDSGLISDEAYHEFRMSLLENIRAIIPPINALKDERNRQNKIVYIHPITEVRGFLSFDL